MARYWAIFFCFALCATYVRAQLVSPQLLVPSPLGVVLTIGKWIYDANINEQVYYVEVEGIGFTSAQARSNGFRLAVESALGSLISSESEVQNGRLKRDEIISYAAGFIEKFEIIQSKSISDGYVVSIKVWVRRSALADRLLGSSKVAGKVDGAGASIQLETLNQERVTGDVLVNTVLKDFPKRAFEVKLNRSDVVRNNRSAQIEIPFSLSWSQDYLRSLWIALNSTSQVTSSPAAVIDVNPGFGWIFKDYGGRAKYDDKNKFSLLVNKMVLSKPSVLVTLRNSNRAEVFSTCYHYQELDHNPQYQVTEERFVRLSPHNSMALINGAYTMNSQVTVPIGLQILEQIASVDIEIVPQTRCPNR